MKLSRLTVGVSAALLGALAIGSSSAWARPVAQAFAGPEAAFATLPTSAPRPPTTPSPVLLPKPAQLPAASASDLPETGAPKNVPAPPTLPAEPRPGRTSLRAAALDLRDPWGEGSLAVLPPTKSSTPSIDLVDPWDPSHRYPSPVSAPSMPLLDPWTAGR